jgi:AraC-like DNA-binding protein
LSALESFQRVGFLAAAPGLLRKLGVDPSDVLAAAGLNPHALDDPEATIPFAAMGRLVHIGAERTGCSHFGLLIGEQITAASFGLVGELMCDAPNLSAALQDFVKHQHRHANGGVAYLLKHGDYALFGYAVYQPGVHGNPLIYDGAAAAAFNLVAGLRRPADPVGMEVLISRTDPPDPEPYRQFFGVNIHYNADHTGVLFPLSWLRQEVTGANAERRRTLEDRLAARSRVDDTDSVNKVRRALRIGLISGRISGKEIAADLNIGRRTLHRHLAAQGFHFQQLVDETRFELARQLLANTQIGVGEIGLILRYADPSLFTRAFIRWAGVNPSRWRSDMHGADNAPRDTHASWQPAGRRD